MKYTDFGKTGVKISRLGYGCMRVPEFEKDGVWSIDEERAIPMLRRAYELGVNYFDTAIMYSHSNNQATVGKAVKPFRDKIVLTTKFTPCRVGDQDITDSEKLTAKGIRKALEDSLRRLGTDYVDCYYEHRVPLASRPEEVAEVMGELIKEGKIRGWGQSQSTPEQIRRAHAVTPLSRVQSEYSMMERMFEAEVIPLCRELGIGFVAFSPMASGFLSGKYTASMTYVGDDVRRAITRFAKENVIANQPLLDALERLSQAKGCTKAQLALAWMLAKWRHVVPIPGMRSDARIEENLGAADAVLSPEELAAIEAELAKITIHGNRTDEDIQRMGYVKAQ